MASPDIRPTMLFADPEGHIYDHPHLRMLCRRGNDFTPPRPDELMPLPEESELFLLPGRSAVGLDPDTGQVEALEDTAVAAFVSPGHTLAGLAAYMTLEHAPVLPLFAYCAVGFARGRFYVCAKKTDEDPRQIFKGVPRRRIQDGAREWLRRFPDNRLVRHLTGCALTSCCPAARNLCLGRFEAPLPTSRKCNARCVGCLSLQPKSSGFPATQQRITFRPEPREIVEVMRGHAEKAEKPIFSFGQGCEGEPLTEAPLIAEAVAAFRREGGRGTVNVNTNASLPDAVASLAEAGISSIRVSLNSARPSLYDAYYRPVDYSFNDVRRSIVEAKKRNRFVSLNLLFFPGVTDTEEELAALTELVQETGVDFIQLRNLNMDPERYLQILQGVPDPGPSMGLNHFRRRLRKSCPGLAFGYFNPYLGD